MTRFNSTSSYSSSNYSSIAQSLNSENSSLLSSIKSTDSVKETTRLNCMYSDRPKPILDIEKVIIPTKSSGKDPSAEPFSLDENFSIKTSINDLANNEKSLQKNSAPDAEKREAARSLFQSLRNNRGASEEETSQILSELEK